MNDQAADLRELVRRRATSRPAAGAQPARSVAVGGGKGGVGTTTSAVNLAVALAARGHRTALVDADPRGGDVAMLLGLDARRTLADVLLGRSTLDEALAPGPFGLWVLAADWSETRVPHVPEDAEQRLFAELGQRVDFVLADTGNVPGPLARRFWHSADMALTVTTPETAAVMNAYARIKATHPSCTPEAIHTVVNRARSARSVRKIDARLARACRRFLGISPVALGYVADDPSIPAACGVHRPSVTLSLIHI